MSLAQEYKNSEFVSAQNNNCLFDACGSQDLLDNIILLNVKSSPDQYQHLADCEHFDVVFVRNIADNFEDDWHEALEAK